LAAFLAAIDSLVRQGVAAALPDETQIVYVLSLNALSNDIQRNLEAPLAGIREVLRAQGLPDVDIRAWVRTGDTPAAAYRRDHTGIALYFAEFGIRPQNVANDAHGDRGRNPCSGAE
jgi:Lhr-like helicase